MESTENLRLKRLQYRSWHRGCKETDLILGHYSRQLAALSPAQLDDFEALLDEDDAVIWDWLTGKAEAPARYLALVDSLRNLQLPA